MVILDGKKLSEKILNNLKKEIKNRRLKLKMAAVLVGNSSVSSIYIKKKEKACKELGIDFNLFHFPEKISARELQKEIEKIAKDKTISGIIVQLPLPKQINAQEVLNVIPPEKDIDALSETSIGKFAQKNLSI
jgi:methylenetetrahydrofolate dehydrogenase (NADP+)/methenyltetrahydrofolate cyclohydrolase